MRENISDATAQLLRRLQQNEADEFHIYRKIAACVKDEPNRTILLRIADEEQAHGEVWGRYTGVSPAPHRARVLGFALLSRVFGYTFALKLMESGEQRAELAYADLIAEIPDAQKIMEDEQLHENELIALLDEERLQYVGSMVLGLNDALVELTGTLAGLSFALQNNRLIALSGLITGVSATFSMTASAYLSAKSDGDPHALKSCAYTGGMYLITVALLVLPYLLLPANLYVPALIAMLVLVTLIILVFNYYISVAKSLPFKRRFLEMFAISGSVAALSFVVGLLVKAWLGIDL